MGSVSSKPTKRVTLEDVAKEAGVLFVPIACSGTRVLTFHKAWDKSMIPLPFSKMVIDFGEPQYLIY